MGTIVEILDMSNRASALDFLLLEAEVGKDQDSEEDATDDEMKSFLRKRAKHCRTDFPNDMIQMTRNQKLTQKRPQMNTVSQHQCPTRKNSQQMKKLHSVELS